MKKCIYIIALLGCLRMEGAAVSGEGDLHVINNTRKPLFVRFRRGDGTAKPTDSPPIFKLSKDKTLQLLYDLKGGSIRLRILPEEFAQHIKAADPENYAYDGVALKPGLVNAVVIAKEVNASGLASALQNTFNYRPTILNLKKGSKITSSEPVSAILLTVKSIETLKKQLSQLMATWSTIKLDSAYETEQTIKENGTTFSPIKTTPEIARGKPGQENFVPTLDIRSLEELESELK